MNTIILAAAVVAMNVGWLVLLLKRPRLLPTHFLDPRFLIGAAIYLATAGTLLYQLYPRA